ncbi:MAG: tetratricopeptide repeat protein, partial [Desulfobacteraceae bacterium]
MTEERAKRKLSAILSADVKGYSRLMGEDELRTVRTLEAYREMIAEVIRNFSGRVVDSPGDNLLAEFSSVVDAVESAVEIQKELKAKNAELPEERRMEFRIGINLGDVIEEGERIYGDGVNIAARIEGMAEAGGICVSRTAYDSVKNKLNLGFEYLGEHRVKNISEPVQVYRVLTAPEAVGSIYYKHWRDDPRHKRRSTIIALLILIVGIVVFAIWNFYLRPDVEPASVERMAFPLPDKPSIAVLPFENMSGDPKQQYFSDGLTDQIINSLSKVPYLFVIARISTFTYKGKPVKVQKVAEDLGVRYVLEGSVQRSADRVRITAQLIDAITGLHIWSERYDRELRDIFAIQDDITMEITKAMRIEITEGEQARLWQKCATMNLKAYLKLLEGMEHHYRLTKEDNARARQLFEEAIALEPEFANAYVSLGATHFYDARYGWSGSRARSIEMAFKYAQKAIALDDTSDLAHTLIGGVYLLKRQHEKNIAQAERAIAINPNGAHNNAFMAGALGCSGRWEESIGYAEKAMRLAPFPPVWFYWILGRSYFMTGQYDKAVETLRKAVHVSPDYLTAHAFLAASLGSLDRKAEAAAEADEVLRINPNFSLDAYAKTLPYKNRTDIERYLAALRKAGLPETQPLPLPDKPSIAVLPFTNIGNPEQEYIADGITEQIITALARNPYLFVIASNSTFTYKGKPVKVQQVSRELGVRYVLEGSVQKSGDRIRITTQLIDATTGAHIWAANYDRDLKDIFALQDEITIEILKGTMGKLLGFGDLSRVKGTTNVEAYLKYLKSRPLNSTNERNNRIAQQLLEKSIALDPEYAQAYASLGVSYCAQAMNRWGQSPGKDLQKASELAQKAIDLDQNLSVPHGTLGWIYLIKGKHDEAIAEAKKAVDLAPNDAWANGCLGTFLAYADRPDEAILVSENALRLNPFPTDWDLLFAYVGYFVAGRYEEALAYSKRAQKLNP